MAEKAFKPANYNSVSPYFIVDDAQKLIELIKTVFDGIETRRYNNPDGSIMHAEVQIDDSVIMLSNSTNEYPAIRQLLHVYVRDIDQTFERAVNAGCEVFSTPKTNDGDPDKRGTFIDFGGNMWSIATQQ